MTPEQLDTARHAAAEREWLAYDLGEHQSESQDGWAWTAPGNELARRIYVSADGDAPSVPAVFRVRFVAGSADVAAAHASLDGHDIDSGGVHRAEAEDQG